MFSNVRVMPLFAARDSMHFRLRDCNQMSSESAVGWHAFSAAVSVALSLYRLKVYG